MSLVSRWAQGLYVVTVGIAFGVRGVISLGDPDFWNAVTPLDYAAVWTSSLSLLLVAPATLILVREARATRGARIVGWIVAIGAVIAAFANVIEDGLHLKDFGTLYVLGALPFAYGQVVLALLLARGERKAFALVPLLTFVGMVANDRGGGILTGAAWIGLAIVVMAGRPSTSTQPPEGSQTAEPA